MTNVAWKKCASKLWISAVARVKGRSVKNIIFRSYNEGTACFNKCSDSPMKSITMTGFTFLQFVCGDRRKGNVSQKLFQPLPTEELTFSDFDKALPCIGDSCAEAERTCKPSCGMVKTGTKENLGKAFGELTNATSISDFANVDLFGIQKTIAENCRYGSITSKHSPPCGCFDNAVFFLPFADMQAVT